MVSLHDSLIRMVTLWRKVDEGGHQGSPSFIQQFLPLITQFRIQEFVSSVQEDLYSVGIIRLATSLDIDTVLLLAVLPSGDRTISGLCTTTTDILFFNRVEETRWCGLVILSCLDLSVCEQTA